MKKNTTLWYMLLMMVMILSLCTSCSKDSSSDGGDPPISKSDIIGTWYTLEDDWVLVFNDTEVTLYELWNRGDSYELNTSYYVTSKYTIDGNRVMDDHMGIMSVSFLSKDKMKAIAGDQTYIFTRFNGTVWELIDYLNGK